MIGKYEDIFLENRRRLAGFELVVDKPPRKNPKKALKETQQETLERWSRS